METTAAMMIKYGHPDELYIKRIYKALLERCNNPKAQAFYNYGARGITVCDEWMEPVIGTYRFLIWATKENYKRGLELDRIDNDKGYSPENCRFVDRKTNCRNRRSNRVYSIDGQVMSVAEINEKFGISLPKTVIFRRLNDGWDPISAVSIPSKRRLCNPLTIFGINYESISEAVRLLSPCITPSLVCTRVEKFGWHLLNAILIPKLSAKVINRLKKEGWDPTTHQLGDNALITSNEGRINR